ncbi:energy-coupling factor ABC transporter ATP-binding protein [Agromyces atrinae]|uniref:energy-coupling factor ABC transporter ATP-binding protein n=1 Tax=Agromyces atrinae TaxID=592376 RepID=UPI001F584695|nr:ABC transporter ATP-binding protein [Agromyces atrinae]MCI2957237.1 energy-coupling factor ABC transporter ATP-binding protein [Agromyces atrinae]
MTSRSIVLDGVSVEFESGTALETTTLSLDEHRVAVIGSNGSGKSSFARLLNGLTRPARGEVRVHGLDPVRQSRLVRARVGFVFANADAQIVMPTVREDVALSLRRLRLTASETARRVDDALERTGLAGLADASTRSLSGGQKQLLAFAAVTVSEPALIVADEPTASLDAVNARRIRELIRALPQQVVVVTHDLRLAAECDIALRFESGRLVARGPAAEVVARYDEEHR